MPSTGTSTPPRDTRLTPAISDTAPASKFISMSWPGSIELTPRSLR